MRKLLLASSGLGFLGQFVGRDLLGMEMLFIPSAGNLDKNVWWIDKDRDVLVGMGFKIHELDIASSGKAELSAAISSADIVYVAGGNTFYLLKVMRESGFDDLITQYVDSGGLYVGASAGAVIAGLDIEPIASLDEPEKAPGLASTQGLGLVDIIPVPHYDMEDRTWGTPSIKEKYKDKYEVVLITDDQAILVEDDSWKIVDSKRSDLEMDWFNKNH